MDLESYKRPVIYLIDLFIFLFAILISFGLRFEFNYSAVKLMMQEARSAFLMLVIIYNVLYFAFGVNKKTWSGITADDSMNIIMVNGIAVLFVYIMTLLGLEVVLPVSVAGIIFITSSSLQAFSRMFYRYIKVVHKSRSNNEGTPVLVYGAGSAGNIIISELINNPIYNYSVVGVIDDNPKMKNSLILGNRVVGGLESVEVLAKEAKVNEIIFAIPSLEEKRRNQILNHLLKLNLKIKIIKSSSSLMEDQNLNKNLRSVDTRDLLGRGEIKTSDEGVKESLAGKVILVTGAGGSIGSELVRQIAQHNPKLILMLDISETGLYEIQQEMMIVKHVSSDEKIKTKFKALITSIRDEEALDHIFDTYRPEVVFHAAAHKHVPLMEELPKEAIKNNIFGTHNVVNMCVKYNVAKMVNVSTDKAVNPTNVMGASKRFNEMMIQSYNNVSDTKFVAVRFGNVLGSNGSVVPLFNRQIAAGGPLTLTHPEITRYFMTIPEAVRLILQANVYAEGGEIFVLDMGEPVKIIDLAEQLIRLSGLRPYDDIDIKIVGLRPGEKLYEELLMAEEGLEKTENNLIHIAKPLNFEMSWIEDALSEMHACVIDHEACAEEVLIKYVTTYTPEKND